MAICRHKAYIHKRLNDTIMILVVGPRKVAETNIYENIFQLHEIMFIFIDNAKMESRNSCYY